MAGWPLAFQKSTHGDLGRRGLCHPGGLLAFQPWGWHKREWSWHSSFFPCWLGLTQG